MNYYIKYKKYKKKYIEIKNLHGGFNEYSILKNNILDDFFDELNKYKLLFIQEYKNKIKYTSYLNKISNVYNYDKEYDDLFKDINIINKIKELTTISELINFLFKNKYFKDTYYSISTDLKSLISNGIYKNVLIIDINSIKSDNLIFKILTDIMNYINIIIPEHINDNIIILLKTEFNIDNDIDNKNKNKIKKLLIDNINIKIKLYSDNMFNYMKEIEKLKINFYNDLYIKYKDLQININNEFINFYKNFILLFNFIITHTIYCMIHILNNIVPNINIKYLENYIYNTYSPNPSPNPSTFIPIPFSPIPSRSSPISSRSSPISLSPIPLSPIPLRSSPIPSNSRTSNSRTSNSRTTSPITLERSLSKDINITELITDDIFNDVIIKINELYIKLFTDGIDLQNVNDQTNGKTCSNKTDINYSIPFYCRFSNNNQELIIGRSVNNDHFTWHKGQSYSDIGNVHYKSIYTYKLFFLLNSINTRTFCFKSTNYEDNLPIYDKIDFQYLLLLIYYLKYNFCNKYDITNFNKIFNLQDEYKYFDINIIDLEQYELFFTI